MIDSTSWELEERLPQDKKDVRTTNRMNSFQKHQLCDSKQNNYNQLRNHVLFATSTAVPLPQHQARRGKPVRVMLSSIRGRLHSKHDTSGYAENIMRGNASNICGVRCVFQGYQRCSM